MKAHLWILGGALVSGAAQAADTYHDVTISDAQTWVDREVTITGAITIVSGGSLELRGTTVKFSPEVEDTTGVFLQGNGRLKAQDSRFESGSGRQWNLEAHGTCRIEFLRSRATEHTGIRARDRCSVSAIASNIEELQVHGSARVELADGSAAYMALFFTGGGPFRFERGELVAGEGQTRSFDVPTSATTTAHVTLRNADIDGFQLDMQKKVAVYVRGGSGITLGMHLHDVNCGGTCRVTADLTSDQPRTSRVDFQADGGPSFEGVDTIVPNVTVYTTGRSRLDFSGEVQVIEANALDQSKITFGPKARVYANLVQTYDSAEMILNGVTLLRDFYVPPSFTAMGRSVLRINNVRALEGSQVYAVGQGQVHINGGADWDLAVFNEVSLVPPGGIYRRD